MIIQIKKKDTPIAKGTLYKCTELHKIILLIYTKHIFTLSFKPIIFNTIKHSTTFKFFNS